MTAHEDGFAFLHENAVEAGLPWSGPPSVRRHWPPCGQHAEPHHVSLRASHHPLVVTSLRCSVPSGNTAGRTASSPAP